MHFLVTNKTLEGKLEIFNKLKFTIQQILIKQLENHIVNNVYF